MFKSLTGPQDASKSRWVFPLAAFLGLAIVLASWPGRLIGDSEHQLIEIHAGHLTDWHSPMMSVLWRALGASTQSMLIVDAALYWAGMALLADQLRREASGRWALGLLAVGCSPLSIYYLGIVQKDTLLTALFVLAAGLAARFGRASGMVPAFLAMLARANGVFAAPPFFLNGCSLVRSLCLTLALAVAFIPVSVAINRFVFAAQPSHVPKSLQLFDMAGAGDRRFQRCYSSFEWDALELQCHFFDQTPDDLTRPWLAAIAAHPLAYAGHRLAYFNHTIFFLVPPRQECVFVPQLEYSCQEPGAHPLLNDALTRNALVWPITWLVVGFMLLLLPLRPLAWTLTLSGMIYGGAYLLVGVAAGIRYFYWTELAVQIALLWQLAHGLPRWRWIAVAVMTTWLLGYAWRYLPLIMS